MKSSFTQLAVAGGLVGLGFALAPTGANAQEADPAPEGPAPAESVPCVVNGTSVQKGTATITVGPENCDVPVGPISFSAFNLPGGERWPYSEQEVIAHHPANGSMYTAGFYTLNLDFAVPCNWQTDLYRGNSESDPSFGERLFNSDWVEGQVCVVETTPTTVAAATGGPTTTIAVGNDDGETTTTTAPITTNVASAGPTTSLPAAVAPTGAVAGASGAIAGANPSQAALPATGPTETLVIGLLGGTLLGLGTLARRVSRS